MAVAPAVAERHRASVPVEDLIDPWVRAWARTLRLRRRDFLAALTWRQWCAWQGWAVSGCGHATLRAAVVAEARSALLASVLAADLREPKRDDRVPVLTEAALIGHVDDDHLRLWVNHYVHGRSLVYLAARHQLTVHALHLRLANARDEVAALIPPAARGYDLACGQTRLTLW